MVLRQRIQPYRSRQWLSAVHQLDGCVNCGSPEIQAAHRNEGKGGSQKTSDCLTAALCRACHDEIDNAPNLSREERRQDLDRAILKTIEMLAIRGLIGVKP
jgi:hypothetical protein